VQEVCEQHDIVGPAPIHVKRASRQGLLAIPHFRLLGVALRDLEHLCPILCHDACAWRLLGNLDAEKPVSGGDVEREQTASATTANSPAGLPALALLWLERKGRRVATQIAKLTICIQTFDICVTST
jgi:hypothetical protein